MRFFRNRTPVGILLILCSALAAESLQASQSSTAQQPSSAQASADEAYASQKKFATALFNQQHHLEALPIFEELARKNPNDPDVLFGWGACLVDHSATLEDEAAGMKERVQARELLLRAKQLGNNNALLLNLLDLIPPDGSIRHARNPDFDKVFQAGEAAFARNDYNEAIKNYRAVYELDLKNYSAVLFIGDSYFAIKDFVNAEDWYNRAIALSPDTETAYRYEADMLTRNGEMEKERTMFIRAVVAEPYNQIPWRGLAGWANMNHVQLTPVHVNTHTDSSKDGGKGVTVTLNPTSMQSFSTIWVIYSGIRLKWRQEEFQKRHSEEPQYRHSLDEETEALSTAAGLLAKEKKSVIEADPDLSLLKRLADAKLIEPYILLSPADTEIGQDYARYREANRAQLEEYLSRFIVPATPGKM